MKATFYWFKLILILNHYYQTLSPLPGSMDNSPKIKTSQIKCIFESQIFSLSFADSTSLKHDCSVYNMRGHLGLKNGGRLGLGLFCLADQ